jgi:hypothetical protein
MPSYDYRCPANGQVVEVKHAMSEKLTTWAQVCQLAGLDLGDTPADSAVEKLITGGQLVSSGALKNPEPPSCGRGGCGGGLCGF